MKFAKGDWLYWSFIAFYTGIIYSTLSLVVPVRKTLVERFGTACFDSVIWIFGALGIGAAAVVLKSLSGKRRLVALLMLAAVAGVYSWYIGRLAYAIERIHLLEYGLLGFLVLAAVYRQVKNALALPIALATAFLISMGDEWLQSMLPDRIGEIRDNLINLFSAGMGMLLWISVRADWRMAAGRMFRPQLRACCALLIAVVLAIGAFLWMVHGFGYRIQDPRAGTLYSSFSLEEINAINASGPRTPGQAKVYANEAIRHVLQREFYLTNDFKGKDGRLYRMYDRSWGEARILECYYPRFLQEGKDQPAAKLVAAIDKTVARKSLSTVVWSDSLRGSVKAWLGSDTLPVKFASRVKSTIITSVRPGPLALIMAVIIALLIVTTLVFDKQDFADLSCPDRF